MLKRALALLVFAASAIAQTGMPITISASVPCPANVTCTPVKVTTTVTLQPLVLATNLVCTPATVLPGGTLACTLTINQAAPVALSIPIVIAQPNGTTPQQSLSGPSSITITPGSTSGTANYTYMLPAAPPAAMLVAPSVSNWIYGVWPGDAIPGMTPNPRYLVQGWILFNAA